MYVTTSSKDHQILLKNFLTNNKIYIFIYLVLKSK